MAPNAFAFRLKHISPGEALQIPELVQRAGELRSTFGKIDRTAILKANRQRADFVDYLDWTRLHHGLEAAFAEADRYHAAGTAPMVRTYAVVYLTQRGNAFQEREQQLTRAVAENPDDAYVRHQYLLACHANGRRDLVQEGIEGFLTGGIGVDNDRFLGLAELAAQCGLWDLASLSLHGAGPDLGQTQVGRVLAERIRQGLSHDARAQGVPAFMINLPADERRLALALPLFGQMGITVERQQAVDGRELDESTIANVVCRPVGGVPLGKGIVGCALSHLGAWRRIVEGNIDMALIMEDDAIPFSWQDVSRIAGDSPAADITFVNERMSATHIPGMLQGYSDVWDVLGRWPEGPKGWGLDGYVLTKQGAEKLLEFLDTDLIIGHMDGQVGSYCLPSGTLEASTDAQRVGLSVRKRLVSRGHLSGAALNFPLIKQVNFGTSTIADISATS